MKNTKHWIRLLLGLAMLKKGYTFLVAYPYKGGEVGYGIVWHRMVWATPNMLKRASKVGMLSAIRIFGYLVKMPRLALLERPPSILLVLFSSSTKKLNT